MANQTKQLTVTDIESAMARIKSTAKFGMAGTADLETAASVMHDYVRLRKLVKEIKAYVTKATLGAVVAPVVFKWDDSDKSWICYDAEGLCRLTTEVEESCINSMAEIKRILADAEKGETK